LVAGVRKPNPTRQSIGRIGALESWARTVDRAARTAKARRAGPGGIDYFLDQLDPERFATASDQQKLDAADALRRAYFARLALRSAQVRSKRAGTKDAA
jgi:hypothetical protein